MTNAIDYETVKAAKTRKLSVAARNDEGKVIRTGKNLSGNQPFRVKRYALIGDIQPAIAAAPNQVQLIIKHMAANRDPATGKKIIEAMIENGFKTKIDPPVLFAYYRRLLEKLGVQHIV